MGGNHCKNNSVALGKYSASVLQKRVGIKIELLQAAAAFAIKYLVGADECFVFIVMETWSQRMDILFLSFGKIAIPCIKHKDLPKAVSKIDIG